MQTVLVTFSSIELLSTSGVLVSIPKLQYDRLIAGGASEITLIIPLAPPALIPSADWLTVATAARQLVEDIDGMAEGTAKGKISVAADNGEFQSIGHKRERRIDPATFALWCNKQRRRALDREDKAASEDLTRRKRRELHIDDHEDE